MIGQTTGHLALTVALMLTMACARKGEPGAPALDLPAVRALLYACEADAQRGDVAAFRRCLTEQSAAAIDRQLVALQTTLDDALTRAGQARQKIERGLIGSPALRPALVALRSAEGAARALRAQLGWHGQLAAIARSPRRAVANLRQQGASATFEKGAAPGAERHFLRWQGGRWRIDLLKNPAFAAKRERLEGQVRQVANRVIAAAQRLAGQAAGR